MDKNKLFSKFEDLQTQTLKLLTTINDRQNHINEDLNSLKNSNLLNEINQINAEINKCKLLLKTSMQNSLQKLDDSLTKLANTKNSIASPKDR